MCFEDVQTHTHTLLKIQQMNDLYAYTLYIISNIFIICSAIEQVQKLPDARLQFGDKVSPDL